jgi:hypothetical protein
MPDRIEDRARFDLVRYANVWEDAEVLCAALAPAAGRRLLSIASAGDNAFALLAAAELWRRFGDPKPEWTRKFVHLGGGLAWLFFPFLVRSPRVVLAMSLPLTALFVAAAASASCRACTASAAGAGGPSTIRSGGRVVESPTERIWDRILARCEQVLAPQGV